MEIHKHPVAQASFLIRRPVAEVFEAFANPDITTKFWLERSTGRLEPDASLRWYFTQDISTEVRVLDLSENERILIEWDTDSEHPTTVEWTFAARTPEATYVSIVNKGFAGDGNEIVTSAIDSSYGDSMQPIRELKDEFDGLKGDVTGAFSNLTETDQKDPPEPSDPVQ